MAILILSRIYIYSRSRQQMEIENDQNMITSKVPIRPTYQEALQDDRR
jgi:hypothetical protein